MFIRFHGVRRPGGAEMEDTEIETLLDWLANERKLSASTHKQALSALLLLCLRCWRCNCPGDPLYQSAQRVVRRCRMFDQASNLPSSARVHAAGIANDGRQSFDKDRLGKPVFACHVVDSHAREQSVGIQPNDKVEDFAFRMV